MTVSLVDADGNRLLPIPCHADDKVLWTFASEHVGITIVGYMIDDGPIKTFGRFAVSNVGDSISLVV